MKNGPPALRGGYYAHSTTNPDPRRGKYNFSLLLPKNTPLGLPSHDETLGLICDQFRARPEASKFGKIIQKTL